MPDEKLVGLGTEEVRPVAVRVFLQDPLVAASDHRVGLTTLSIPGEPYLGAGPTTGRVQVVDLDADRDVVHPPVRPLARGGGFAVGRGAPVGLTYRDYARAVFRADEVAYPVDDRGYRQLVADTFRRRGVVRSRKDAAASTRLDNDAFRTYDVERIASTTTDAYVFVDANRETLGIPRDVNFAIQSLHRTRKRGPKRYYSPREIVIEYVWDEDVPLDGRRFGGLNGATFTLWCGGTLVFDADGNVLHSVVHGGDDARRRRLKAYLAYLLEEGLLGDEDELALPAAQRRHRITAEVEDGRVRAVRNPALRHEGRRR